MFLVWYDGVPGEGWGVLPRSSGNFKEEGSVKEITWWIS